jgi:hypothetical protein
MNISGRKVVITFMEISGAEVRLCSHTHKYEFHLLVQVGFSARSVSCLSQEITANENNESLYLKSRSQ